MNNFVCYHEVISKQFCIFEVNTFLNISFSFSSFVPYIFLNISLNYTKIREALYCSESFIQIDCTTALEVTNLNAMNLLLQFIIQACTNYDYKSSSSGGGKFSTQNGPKNAVLAL